MHLFHASTFEQRRISAEPSGPSVSRAFDDAMGEVHALRSESLYSNFSTLRKSTLNKNTQ